MKEQVRSALIAYRSNYPTLNRAAESLQGVSSATVSQLCNGKYELISDEMFIFVPSEYHSELGMDGITVSKVGIYLFLNSLSPFTAAYHQTITAGSFK